MWQFSFFGDYWYHLYFLSWNGQNALCVFFGLSLVSICVYVFAFGMILPTSNTLAMEPAGDMPGFAASLIGSVQVSLGALGSAMAAVLFTGTHHTVPILMGFFGVLTVAMSFLRAKA